MDQRLKELIKQLGGAIDESLSGSKQIANVIGEIKKEGYDVLLFLEATIGFARRPGQAIAHKNLEEHLTETDQQFLKALSISLDE